MVNQADETRGTDSEPRLISSVAVPESVGWPSAVWVALIASLIGFLVMIANGSDEAQSFLLLGVLAVTIGFLAKSVARPLDATWLPNLIIWAWIVKMMASTGRYLALELLYQGRGDATGYNNYGIRYAPLWRSFEPPDFDTGTEFVRWFTGLIYALYTPTKLGGFLIFATMAFVGQVLLYMAFRRAFPSHRVKWYALLIFFFPNLLYWPSSIGKESLMLLFIGIGAYAAVRLFVDYRPRWLLLFAVGLLGCGVIRSHIALLMALSAMGVLLVGRASATGPVGFRRWASLSLMLLMSFFVVRYVIVDFGIDISSGISEALVEEELDPIFSNVEGQTDRGGSTVEGTAIRSPADVPEAVIRVVFRPLPTDAHNTQALANSIVEGLFLMVLFIWRTPAILRNSLRHWRDPYILFSLLFTAGFIFGHSAVLNLGIIARQRSQAIPFILVLLVELGKRRQRSEEDIPPAVSPSEFPSRPVAAEGVAIG